MKKLFLILAIVLLAVPAFADYRGTGTWTVNPISVVRSSFIGKLPDGTELEQCITPVGTIPNCVAIMPEAFNPGGEYWIRTYNSVGQFTDTTHLPFSVALPDAASGAVFNWQHFNP